MYKKPKKAFPIKYMRKGLFPDEDFSEEKAKKEGQRRVKKPKFSVHSKTKASGKKSCEYFHICFLVITVVFLKY